MDYRPTASSYIHVVHGLHGLIAKTQLQGILPYHLKHIQGCRAGLLALTAPLMPSKRAHVPLSVSWCRCSRSDPKWHPKEISPDSPGWTRVKAPPLNDFFNILYLLSQGALLEHQRLTSPTSAHVLLHCPGWPGREPLLPLLLVLSTRTTGHMPAHQNLGETLDCDHSWLLIS